MRMSAVVTLSSVHPPSPASIRRAGSVIERLFRTTLSRDDWSTLADILSRAWSERQSAVLGVHNRLGCAGSSPEEIGREERRNLMAELGALGRLSEGRDYASWLHRVVMRARGG